MVIFLFHQSNLLLVLDLPPGQLTVRKLDQHVEQRPEIVVSPHLLVLVSVDGGVSDGAPEAGSCAGGPHLARGVGVLPRQPEVQHVDLPHGLRSPPN